MNIFQDILALLEQEEKQVVLPLLAQAVTNIATNPTKVNAVAQGVNLLGQLVVSQIPIGQAVLVKVATDVTAAAMGQVAPPALAPVAAPVPAPGPAPVVPPVVGPS